MPPSITPNTTSARSGMAAAKISARCASMVNAMIMAPNTMMGERSVSRSVMLIPDWIWLMSLVMRVIMAAVPTRSVWA